MLDYVIKETQKFLEEMPKSERKKKGQFFTSLETAQYMASLFFVKQKDEISLLDPGAGTGVLSAAFIERIHKENVAKKLHLTCYETDEQVLPILENNLRYIKEHSHITIEYDIIRDDYLLSQANDFEEDILAKSTPTTNSAPKKNTASVNELYPQVKRTHFYIPHSTMKYRHSGNPFCKQL